MPQRDDYPNGARSVGRPCGGSGAAATMGERPWGSWRRSGLSSAVRLEVPQTTIGRKTWNECVKVDMKRLGLIKDDARWRS